MKKYSLLLSFVLSFLVGNSNAQQGWFILSHSEVYKQADIAFPSVDTGYIFSINPQITTDAGKTWNKINIGYKIFPRHPFFINSQLGFLLDGDSAVIRTTNTGQSWDRFSINYPKIQNLLYIYFQNPSTGFICGRGDPNTNSSGILLKTVDSGKSWSEFYTQPLSEGGGFEQIAFRDSMHGYLLATESIFSIPNAFLLGTTDGGNHWTKNLFGGGFDLHYAKSLNLWSGFGIYVISKWNEDGSIQGVDTVFKYEHNGNEISSMSFANDSIGFVATYAGKIYKTTNSGVSWFLQNTPKEFYYGVRIVASSTDVAYALGDSVIIKTTDGGGPPVNAVRNIIAKQNFNIISNPITSSADFQFKALKEPTVFELFDLLGRSILHEQLSAGQTSLHLDMQKFNSGIYLARLGGETVRFIRQ